MNLIHVTLLKIDKLPDVFDACMRLFVLVFECVFARGARM